jgi:hypothetical protein
VSVRQVGLDASGEGGSAGRGRFRSSNRPNPQVELAYELLFLDEIFTGSVEGSFAGFLAFR